jgi:hypothetical protein
MDIPNVGEDRSAVQRVRSLTRLKIIGGAADAYIPTPEEEEHARKEEAELIRVRTQSKDRIKEIEHKRQEMRRDSPSS